MPSPFSPRPARNTPPSAFTASLPALSQKTGYGNETYFRVEERPVGSFADLVRELERLTTEPHSFVIRGAPLPGIDRRRHRRLLKPRDGIPATYSPAARHHFAIDLDKLPRPAGIDPADDPEAAIEYLVGKLPPELGEASVWWQLTASQGLPGADTLSARLWLWSDEPLADDDLKGWALAANAAHGDKLIDPSLYRAVQPHYVAAPIFTGMDDPLPLRFGARKGHHTCAAPVMLRALQAVDEHLTMIGGPKGFRGPIVSTIAAYIAKNGADAPDAPIKTLIRGHLSEVGPGKRSEDDLDRYGSDEHLDDIIAWLRQQQTAAGGDGGRAAAEMAEVNASYAVIANAGKVAVLREYRDEDDRPVFALMRPDDFRLWLGNRPDLMIAGAAVSVANFWLKHPDRRQYDGIGFMPENARPGWYNLWKDFAIEPKPGDRDLFLAHLKGNVAQGDEALYRWVVGWLAAMVQHPGRKPGTSLVLRGKMGVGKTIIGKTMGQLLGRHYVVANRPRYITGQFNSHLVSCLLLHADEGFWAGDKAAEGVLKDLVTGDSHLVEFKNFEPIPVRNYIRLLVTSNENWVVPAGMEERRFATVTVGEAHMKDRPYFAAIERQLEGGGYAALLHHLLNFDLDTVDIGAIPVTDGLLDQKLESLGAIERWWLTTLREGTLPGGCGAENTCPVKALYQRYLDHAAMTHLRNQRAIETQFGITLRKLVPISTVGKPRLRRYKDSYYTHQDGLEKTGYVYTMPPLSECRARFEALMGHKIDWQDDPLELELPDDVVEELTLEEFDLLPEEEDWDKDSLPTPEAATAR
jgi:hypothetical protein